MRMKHLGMRRGTDAFQGSSQRNGAGEGPSNTGEAGQGGGGSRCWCLQSQQTAEVT